MVRFARASLLTRFSALTLLALVVLAVVLGHVLEARIEARALENAEAAATLVARAVVQPTLRPAEVRHGFTRGRLDELDDRLHVDGHGFTRGRLDELDDRLHVDGFAAAGIDRVNIFNAKPEIIYSDDRSKIGRSAAASDKIREALRGAVVSKFVQGVDHSGGGDRVLEVFVPLRFHGNPIPAGVYEVYLSYKSTEAAIRSDTLTMYGILVGGFLVLYGALYRIVAIASRKLQHQATHDELTGLPNRLLLNDRIERALALAQRSEHEVAVMLIDLDRFKEINDTLGHRYGDELLRQVAPRLHEVLRDGETVARLGGDEFAVLLPAVSAQEDVRIVADRLRAALHCSFEADGMKLDLEASVGVAMSPHHGTTTDELIKNADIAMYAAKEIKAGAVFFTAQDHVSAPSGLTLLGELRRALDADEQLFVHYQPQYALDDERLIGVEALLRWDHPERGLIPPGDFITVAEGTGIILRITERVLRLSLSQSRRWLDDGHELPLAVNVSTRCLQDALFPQLVERLLAEHGVPARWLRLEITESAVMADAGRSVDTLARLNALGVELSIDDFGTGYTSMAHLRRLPIRELKVDRSFVIGMTASEEDAILVRTAIDLGHNFGLRVVAEGVEGPEHVAALRALGCDVAQGYYYARPMASDALMDLLREAAVPLAPSIR